MKNHLKIISYQYYSHLPQILIDDLERCADNRIYNHYSMKKGNEYHLTLIVETSVLKLQKMARSFFKVRSRAAAKL